MIEENLYEAFLKKKIETLPAAGLERELDGAEKLFPFQRKGVAWALRKGRAALFLDAGLGKSGAELTWCRNVSLATETMALLLTPLSVAGQMVHIEAAKFGIPAQIITDQAQARPDMVNVCNYQKLHRLDPSAFGAVCLDESSILKAMDGKTKEALITAFSSTPFRLAGSATPSPNDVTELANHAEFLGVMTRGEMLGTFFVHDGKDSAKWRLKDHARHLFWKWVASWALMAKRPSDLGFDDAGYVLPRLYINTHTVETTSEMHKDAGFLVPMEARTFAEKRAARRASLPERAMACAERTRIDGPCGACDDEHGESREPCRAKAEQWVVWCELNDEQDALEELFGDEAVSIRGATKEDEKERLHDLWFTGKKRVLISKPSIYGHGLNWQHASHMAFVGVSESYEQFYQSVRREWRFGQKRETHVHTFLSAAEAAMLRTLKEKEAKADEMAAEMVRATRAVADDEAAGRKAEVAAYRRDVRAGKRHVFHLGDSCEAIRDVPDNSVDYTIGSPPFSSLYTFSDSERDLSNCSTDGEFYEHMRFLVREQLRVTKPGRLCSFHCCDLPTVKHKDGFTGLKDFSGLLIKVYEAEGWLLHGKTTIWKSPAIQRARTKAKGLMYGNVKKDSADARSALADYLVTMQKPGAPDAPVLGDLASALAGLAECMQAGEAGPGHARALAMFLRAYEEVMPSQLVSMRKPGGNAVPIKHTPEELPLEEWVKLASPIWMDIDPSDTLQGRAARDEKDERHLSLLQLEVIRRGVRLYSNPGETVADWFAGVGSTGVVAVELGRLALLCELKESYWKQGTLFVAEAEAGPAQARLGF